jgi:hypothetical protein
VTPIHQNHKFNNNNNLIIYIRLPSGVISLYDTANWYWTRLTGLTVAMMVCLDRAGKIPSILSK